MGNRKWHLAADAAVMLLLWASYCFVIFPRAQHEIIGTLALLVVIWHSLLNHGGFTSMLRGAWPKPRTALLIVNVLMCIAFIGTIITGFMLSEAVLPALGDLYRQSMLLHHLHISFAYYSLLFAGIHHGMHVQGKAENPVMKGLKLFFAVLGVYGVYVCGVCEHLQMSTSFVAVFLPPELVAVLHLGIFALAAISGQYLMRCLRASK